MGSDLFYNSLSSFAILNDYIDAVFGVGYAYTLEVEVLSLAVAYSYSVDTYVLSEVGYIVGIVRESNIVAVESEPAYAVARLFESHVGVAAVEDFSLYLKEYFCILAGTEVVLSPAVVGDFESLAQSDGLVFAEDKLEYVVANLLELPAFDVVPAVHVATEIESDSCGGRSSGSHCDSSVVASHYDFPVASPGAHDVGVAGFEVYGYTLVFGIYASECVAVELIPSGSTCLCGVSAFYIRDLERGKTIYFELEVVVYDCELCGVSGIPLCGETTFFCSGACAGHVKSLCVG